MPRLRSTPSNGGFIFAENPARAAPEARIIWHADLDPGALRVSAVRADPCAADAVDSPGIKTALHESNTRQGLFGLTAVMGPPPEGSIKIPSSEDVKFEHMGNHVMMYGVRADSVPLTFVFFSGKQVQVEAPVRPAAAVEG